MRPRGAGTVTELGPRRFWARGPRPERESLGVYPTREEAEDVLSGVAEARTREDRTRLPGATLREIGRRVLEERERELPRSAQAERSRWKRIEAAPFIDDPIVTLDAQAIDRWARRLLRELPGSAKPTLSLLSAICSRAIYDRVLTTNPCRDVKLRRPPRTHEPWTYLQPHEQRALLLAPIAEVDRLHIACLLGTGVRDGELFALRLADVHVDAVDPHIVIRYGSKFGPPKGKKVRRVPLFGLGLRSFQRWLEVLPSYCPKNPRGLAFPGRRGGFQKPGEFLVRHTTVDGRSAYLDDFREALSAAGIVAGKRHDGRPVRAHDLRHTFAASLVSGWWGQLWRLEDLCAVMGHHSITITQRYAHLAPGRVLDLAGRTPGLPSGDGAPTPIAIRAANPAPIALLAAGAEGTACSPHLSTVPRTYGAGNPNITRALDDLAREAIEATAKGDPSAMRRLLEVAEAVVELGRDGVAERAG